MGKRIAVFGASGQIGREVTAGLLEAGHKVTALRHKTPVPAGCSVVEGTISDPEAVRQAVGDNEIVCQLATTKGDRNTFMDVAVRGTYHILDAIAQRGGCEQFLLAGADASMGIWFYRQPLPIREDAPLRAYPGVYALSKVLEETLLQQYSFQCDLPYTVLRMGWVHTPAMTLKLLLCGQVAGRLWKNMFRSAMSPELLKRHDGEGLGFAMVAVDQQGGLPLRRTTVSFPDVCQGWMLAVGNPLARNHVFNLVHPAWDYAAVGTWLAERLGISAERVPLDAHSFDMDTAKIRARLGWKPTGDVFSMLEEALATLKKP